LVTGIDLVCAQLRVAEGEELDPKLAEITPRGHAIEVRLYAEDPYRGFAPSPGRIEALRLPQGPGVRNDCGVLEGSEVTVHYDPMLGKLIVWGEDRRQALSRLRRALMELRIDGIRTTAPLYLALLDDPDYLAARLDIGMLDRKLQSGELGGVGAASARGVSGNPIVSASEAAADQDSEVGVDDMVLISTAVAHLEGRRESPQAQSSSPTRSRSAWHQAARREALRGAVR
jgi:acetyl-CoA carboxylase biotin carboxylase subunit